PPVMQRAASLGVPAFALPIQPGDMNVPRAMRADPAYAAAVRDAAHCLDALGADFLVGWAINVLPRFVLESARHAINVHPSDLPRYRGGFPLEAQILDGSRMLHVSVHETIPRIDAGDVLARSAPLKIKRSDTMTGLLHRSLPVGAALAAHVVDGWGRLPPVPPLPHEGPVPDAWGIRRVRGADGRLRNEGILGRLRVEWELDTADAIGRAARAFDMIGGATTDVDGRIWRVRAAKRGPEEVVAPVGTVLGVGPDGVLAQALDRQVALQGGFMDGSEGPAVGACFRSTSPISKLLMFPDAER
ncbi:MAG: hypothetical protein KC656_08815, partial [Myxococcales bacterium]|nr:hypothetical protein [Myxococcales bacterium]